MNGRIFETRDTKSNNSCGSQMICASKIFKEKLKAEVIEFGGGDKIYG